MFRSDRDALAQEVEDLRRERAALRAQNDALATDLLARRQDPPPTVVKGNVYKKGIAHLTPGERVALSRQEVTAFPVWAALALHFLTFGFFSLVHFSQLHDRLPRAESDDPSTARAVGFTFIPYFFIYWIVFNTVRLADRLNLQFRLRGLPDRIPRGISLAAGISSAIPQIYLVLGFPLFWPVAIYYLQRAANELAALSREAHDGAAAEGSTERAAPRVRVPLVRDLPGPEAIADQAEIEADAVDMADATPRARARARARSDAS
jgi:hypothetical protein